MTDSSLHIEKSLNEARWVLADAPLDQVELVARRYDLPEAVARLLCARGVKPEEVEDFLHPTLRNHFPDPLSLAGMEECTAYLATAIKNKKSIAIFGDFDVDGATSSAVLYRFLKHCGIDAPIYIPDRLTEGYGPNTKALATLKDQGAEIVILLDCGTTAFETIQAGADLGLEIVIVDHHEAEQTLPAAVHVINPKRRDDTSGLDVLAAVGVTFLLCVAVNASLRALKFFEQNGIDEAPLKSMLDLVALGTVCDMVPLTGANRLFVRHGFLQMAQTGNTGLKALIDVSGIDGPVTPYHAGFVLGPRINAGSRVHQSDLGAKLLSTNDPEEAQNIAWLLNDCNDKRKALQAEMEREAIAKVEAHGLDQNPVIIVDGEGWHTGLSGLVAGRLKEKYGRPACVIAYVKSGGGTKEGRGSGRSIPGVHIAEAFIDARNEGLIEKGGGHAMAGGFTVMPDQLEAFRTFMIQHIQNQMDDAQPHVETMIDGVLSVRGTKPALIKLLHEHIGPFGQEHPEPMFLFRDVRIHSADIVGSSHIRTMISDAEGGARIKAMAFRAAGTPLGEALLKETAQPFHIVGRVKIDTWNGANRAEIHIQDAAFALGGIAALEKQAGVL